MVPKCSDVCGKNCLFSFAKFPFSSQAGQASQLDTMIPLTILRASKLILIGDPKQLPATVKDKLCQQADYSRSYLERICDGFRGHKDFAPMLKLQYRMNAAICNFPSDKFYGGQLKSDS